MQIKTHHQWKSVIVRLCLGSAVLAAATNVVQAQTYYYYPATTGSYPATAAGATTAPAYYYYPSGYSNQITWNGYTPQYYQVNYNSPVYQPSYPPQTYQATYTQPTYATQAPQPTATATQYVQTSYVQPTAQPAAAATAAPAAATGPETTATAATVPAATVPAATAPAAATVPVGDPYGFMNWLNATRAAYGLGAVGYDPNLENWAAMNSAQQASSGLGHFVMGPARRQNSAMGGFPGIESMWMASPAHRAALLDPSIQWIGIAAYGAYWTFNAY